MEYPVYVYPTAFVWALLTRTSAVNVLKVCAVLFLKATGNLLYGYF